MFCNIGEFRMTGYMRASELACDDRFACEKGQLVEEKEKTIA